MKFGGRSGLLAVSTAPSRLPNRDDEAAAARSCAGGLGSERDRLLGSGAVCPAACSPNAVSRVTVKNRIMLASFLLDPIIGGAVVVIIFADGRKSTVSHLALFIAASVRPPLIGNHSRSLFGPSCRRMAVVLQAAGGVFERNADRGCYHRLLRPLERYRAFPVRLCCRLRRRLDVTFLLPRGRNWTVPGLCLVTLPV